MITETPRRNARPARNPLSAAMWHKSAPPMIVEADRAGRPRAAWKAWRRHLRTRTRPTDPDVLFAGPDADGKDASALAESLHEWLRDVAGGKLNLDFALSALGWCRRLPRLAAVLPARRWWRLLDHLLQTAAEAGMAGDDEFSDGRPVLHQLLAGELALTLAYLFPELVACRQLIPQARRTLSAGLAELVDRKGLPQARHFERLPALLACWTRCRALGSGLKHGCWPDKTERRYRRVAANALRLARRDGSQVFSDPASTIKSDCRVAGKLAPAVHSTRAAAAVLRPDWSKSAPRLAVLYPGTSCRVELGCGKDVLWSGPWALDVRIDGASAVPSSPWNSLCWMSDKDVDYLELEIDLGEGVRVERHLLLARKDRFLLLADAVLASRPAVIEYRGTLPLCSGVTFRGACETREGVLVGRKPRAMAVPLALPEWQADRRRGELTTTAAGLELRQTADGTITFRPAVLRRGSPPLVQAAHLAAAYRGRFATGSAGRRGRGISRGDWQEAMADLSFPGPSGESLTVGPQPVDRDAGGPIHSQGRDRVADRDRIEGRGRMMNADSGPLQISEWKSPFPSREGTNLQAI